MNFEQALIEKGISSDTVRVFVDWHKKNPEIWKEFEKLALQAIAEGHKKWSANGIAEIVRWNLRNEKSGEWKFNNSYRAYYARVFILKYPQHRNFFELREARGIKNAQ